MIGSADLHKAMNSVWDSQGLDLGFTSLWSIAQRDKFSVLNDSVAVPKTPFPYCVFEFSPGSTTDRMSGGVNRIREIRDVPLLFRIHAQEVSGDVRTAKKIAADLAETVMRVFGGDPDTAATPLVLDNGHHLITRYQTDYSVYLDDGPEWTWIIDYLLRLDIPVAA